ncbi:MAG TPA: insulinase family protein [Planctomycetota bacterium]|nr:insulinase family protein [Planctomycetota bacterium]
MFAALGLGALCAAAGTAQAPAPKPGPANEVAAPPEPVTFTAPDGSRFVLLADPSLPLVHWAVATFADPAQDPPGLEGLALATMRASLGGTWRTGSVDAAREQQALAALDEAWQATMRQPSPEASARVRSCDDAARALCDDSAFLRVLAAAPAHRPEILDRGPASVLLLTTVAEAIGDVGNLLVERREQQALRDLPQIWMHDLIERIQKRGADTTRGVHAELLTLAMPSHPAVRSFEPPSYHAPTREQAFAVWNATQRPDRTVHVLLGGFDPAAAEPVLRRTFAATSLPRTPAPPAPPVRPITGMRRSIVSGSPVPVLTIAWMLPPTADRFVLEAAAWSLGRGTDSRLGQLLQRAGRTSATVSCAAPWPYEAGGHALMLLEIRDPNGTDKLADLVLEACKELGKVPPSQASMQTVAAAMQRRWSALTANPRELAAEIASSALSWPDNGVSTQCPDRIDAKAVQTLLSSVFSGQPVLVEGRR